MDDKMKLVLIGLGAAAVVGGVAAFVHWRKKKKEQERDVEEIKQEAIERIMASYRTGLEEAPLDYEGEAVIDPEDDGPVENLDPYRVFPDDDKPDLDELAEKVSEKVSEMEESPTTMWGTGAIEFDDMGRPMFKHADFEGEKDRIEEIFQEDYNDMDDFVEYSRDTAVWFPKAGVMVNNDLEPIEIVDAVGPTAFSKLLAFPDKAFFVANHEMMRLYELSINELPLAEVMEEVCPTYNTSYEM